MADEQRASASAAYALAQLRRAIDSLAARLQGASEDLQARFGPAIDGLAHVIAGGRFDKSGRALQPASGRRFLGWATGSHWVLDHADTMKRRARVNIGIQASLAQPIALGTSTAGVQGMARRSRAAALPPRICRMWSAGSPRSCSSPVRSASWE